jgi:predicted nucleic acid-binding Zn ribbon protein
MVYDYKCRDCDNIWQENHSINIKNAVQELSLICPICNSGNIFKYIGNYGTATIVFKGTGWVHKDIMLDKIGMPKATQNSAEAREAMKKRL